MAVFEAMGVYAPDETHARAEVLYENYTNTRSVEIETMVAMAKTGFSRPAPRTLLCMRPRRH